MRTAVYLNKFWEELNLVGPAWISKKISCFFHHIRRMLLFRSSLIARRVLGFSASTVPLPPPPFFCPICWVQLDYLLCMWVCPIWCFVYMCTHAMNYVVPIKKEKRTHMLNSRYILQNNASNQVQYHFTNVGMTIWDVSSCSVIQSSIFCYFHV